jgi:hypothetical protein
MRLYRERGRERNTFLALREKGEKYLDKELQTETDKELRQWGGGKDSEIKRRKGIKTKTIRQGDY